MSSCCDIATDALPATGTLTIALAGNPNSGKTTLFNALTGLRQKVANYPGVTVEKKTGRLKLPDGRQADVIDLPGTYSLISRSPDEQVAMEVLRGLRKDTAVPDAVVVVVDASNLQRNLYLVSQLIELGRPMVIALNMMDIAQRRGLHISPEKLERELGVPVVPVVGYKRKGIDELKAAILKATVAKMPDWPLPAAVHEELMLVGGGLAILDNEESFSATSSFSLSPGSGELGRAVVGGEGRGEGPDARAIKGRGLAQDAHSPLTLTLSPGYRGEGTNRTPRPLESYRALAERLLIGDRAADLQRIADHEPVASLLNSAVNRLRAMGIDPMQADVEAHYLWIEKVANNVVTHDDAEQTKVLDYARPKTLTERVDRILIHKVWGLLIFASIMGLLFVSLFWLAKPIMDGLQAGIKALSDLTTGHMSDGPLKALLNDGVFNGVGTVVVFVPQIALLFLFLAILEDTGYLARAAFLMDRVLAKVGLHGKSFIPLLSSFACAIPGIMATRTIENRRERLATILVAPFMSCSARLPVYTLLIGSFFASYGPLRQAGIMLACYALGIIAAAGTAWIFKRTLTKGPATSFILELPSYKMPQVSQIARQVWSNTRAFLTKAGTTIFCLSVILWAMAYYPRLPEARHKEIEDRAQTAANATSALILLHAQVFDEAHAQIEINGQHPVSDEAVDALVLKNADQLAKGEAALKVKGKAIAADEISKGADKIVEHDIAAAQSEYSISGRLGHLMEPAIRPLGYDWKIGIGLVSAFAAREVFVSSMGIVYSVGEVEEGQTTDLATAMRNDRYTSGPRAGQLVWTPVVAVSLLVWFVLAMQCMSTVAIVRRETGGWSWPIFMIVYMNALAYVVALVVYQVGTRV